MSTGNRLKARKALTSAGSPVSRELAVGLTVAALLFSGCALTFSGKLTSIDSLSIYGQAESLVQTGSFTTPQLSFSDYHNQVGSIEPFYSIILAGPYALSRFVPGISNIHAVLLVPLILTAATGAVVYLTCRSIGYADGTSILVALVYGLGTLAWPYSKTLYREPLLALCWALAVWGLVRWRNTRSPLWAAMVVGAVLCSFQVKVTATVALPAFLLAALPEIRSGRRSWISLMVGGMGLVSGAAAFLVRYGSLTPLVPVLRDLLPSSETLVQLYGLTLNPVKGIVFFAPVVVVALAGLPQLWQRSRMVALAAAGVTASVMWSYSTYSSWHGGWCWGPRFLVPLMPFVALSIAPVLDRWTWLAAPFALGSAVVQFFAATADWSRGYVPLADASSGGRLDYLLPLGAWRQSPVITQMRRWSVESIDALWMQPSPSGELGVDVILLSILLFCTLGAAAILFLIKRFRRPGTPIVFSCLVMVVVAAAVLGRSLPDLHGFPGLRANSAKRIAGLINRKTENPYVVTTVSNEFGIKYYAGLLKGRFAHFWLSPAQRDGFEPLLDPPVSSRELWLVVDYPHLPPEFSGKDVEWWLNEHLHRGSARWIAGFLVARYFYPEGDLQWQAADWLWDDAISLEAYGLSDTSLRPGETLRLAFKLQRTGSWIGYHHLFVHLISPKGKVIGGHDGPIRYGGVAGDTWPLGETLVERRALTLPDNLGPGSYDLVVGFDTPEGFLEAEAADGQKGEIVPIASLEISEPSTQDEDVGTP